MHWSSRILQTLFMLTLYYFFIRGTETELAVFQSVQLMLDKTVKYMVPGSMMTNNEAG